MIFVGLINLVCAIILTTTVEYSDKISSLNEFSESYTTLENKNHVREQLKTDED